MSAVRIAFSGSFSRNRFSLPIRALFLTRVDYHSYSLLSRLTHTPPIFLQAGINVRKGKVTNILEEGVLVPLLVHTSAVSLATECVRLILKIDDIVVTR